MSLSSVPTATFYQLTDYQMELKDYGDASVYRHVSTENGHSCEPPPPYSQRNSLYPALDDCVRMEFPTSYSDHVQVPEYVAIVGLQPQPLQKFGYLNPEVSKSSPNLPHMSRNADSTMHKRGSSGTRNPSLKETREIVQNAQGPKSQEKLLQKMKEAHLVKNKEGKFGLTTSVINKHVFVCNVKRGSPADAAGIKFGDQIFKVNGIEVSGLTLELVNDIFRQSPSTGAIIMYRSRSDYPVFKKEYLKQQLSAIKKVMKTSKH